MGQWTPLASKFPATLVKDVPPDKLDDGQTPDAYGLGLDRPGSLYAGSLPTGTAPPSYSMADPTTDHTPLGMTVANYDWSHAYDRSWALGDSTHRSNIIYYFAPGYGTDLFTQGFPEILCDDTTGNLNKLAFAGNYAVGFKSDSLYLVPNAIDPRGNFVRTLIAQSDSTGGVATGDTTDVCTFEGSVFWNNAKGFFSFDGRQIKEWTQPIRNNIGNFTGAHLDGTNSSGIDCVKRRVIADDGTLKYVVDLNDGGLYDYTTSGFRWTSKTLRSDKRDENVRVTMLRFHVEHSTTADNKRIKYQIMKEDGKNWYPAEEYNVRYENEYHSKCQFGTEHGTGDQERWAIRITSMPSGLYINQIDVLAEYGV